MPLLSGALTAYLGIGGPGDQRVLPFAALGRSGHTDDFELLP